MCGLFGAALPYRYPRHLVDRVAAIRLLGEQAEERGRDSAGLAAHRPEPAGVDDTEWVIHRTRGPFSRLASVPGLFADLTASDIVLGHTRWATQGAVTAVNASPTAAWPLLCTHNGDLDIDTIPFRPLAVGPSWTDSRVLFEAMRTAYGPDRVNTRRLTTILTRMQGRAALAWVDVGEPRRVWLARAGLSPLAIAHDVDGGLWWASNPQWLRTLSEEVGLPMRTIRLLPEGMLLSGTRQQHRVKIQVHAQFKPTVRSTDLRMIRGAVWRNFRPGDRTRDAAVMRHRVIQPALLPGSVAASA